MLLVVQQQCFHRGDSLFPFLLVLCTAAKLVRGAFLIFRVLDGVGPYETKHRWIGWHLRDNLSSHLNTSHRMVKNLPAMIANVSRHDLSELSSARWCNYRALELTVRFYAGVFCRNDPARQNRLVGMDANGRISFVQLASPALEAVADRTMANNCFLSLCFFGIANHPLRHGNRRQIKGWNVGCCSRRELSSLLVLNFLAPIFAAFMLQWCSLPLWLESIWGQPDSGARHRRAPIL